MPSVRPCRPWAFENVRVTTRLACRPNRVVADTSAGLTLHGFFGLNESAYHIALRGNLEVDQSTPATPLSNGTYDRSNP